MNVASSSQRAHRLMFLGFVAGGITGTGFFVWNLWQLLHHDVPNPKVDVFWSIAGGILMIPITGIIGLFVGGVLAAFTRLPRRTGSARR